MVTRRAAAVAMHLVLAPAALATPLLPTGAGKSQPPVPNEFEDFLAAATKQVPNDFATLGKLIDEGPLAALGSPTALPLVVGTSGLGERYPCTDGCCDGALVGGAGAAEATPPPKVLSEKKCTHRHCLSTEYRQVTIEFDFCPQIKKGGMARAVLMAPLDSRRAIYRWECDKCMGRDANVPGCELEKREETCKATGKRYTAVNLIPGIGYRFVVVVERKTPAVSLWLPGLQSEVYFATNEESDDSVDPFDTGFVPLSSDPIARTWGEAEGAALVGISSVGLNVSTAPYSGLYNASRA